MTRRSRTPTRARRGFALLSALWIMVMLSGVGLHVATRARGDRLSVANRIEALRARAAADAGVEHARARLAARLQAAANTGQAGGLVAPLRFVELVLPDTIRIGDARYAVRLRDASARLLLHRASSAELAALFIALRVDAGIADRLSQAIADWQDPDGLKHPRGAEREDYLRAGARELPRDGPIFRLDELLGLRDMTPALFARIEPHLTTSGSGRVNPNTASEAVLASLPAFTPDVINTLVRLRSGGILISSAEQMLAALPSSVRNRVADRSAEWVPRLTFETTEIEFEAEGWLEQGPARVVVRGTFVRAGTVMLTTDRRVR